MTSVCEADQHSNIVKDIGHIKYYSWSSPITVKSLVILSDSTVNRSANEHEDLKPNWESVFLKVKKIEKISLNV